MKMNKRVNCMNCGRLTPGSTEILTTIIPYIKNHIGFHYRCKCGFEWGYHVRINDWSDVNKNIITLRTSELGRYYGHKGRTDRYDIPKGTLFVVSWNEIK